MTQSATSPAGIVPFRSYSGLVGADWLDANDHMNVSMYDRVFDDAKMVFFVEFGIDPETIRRTRLTAFRLEKLVCYEQENMLGDEIEVRSRLVWSDMRRMHHFHELWNCTRNRRAAYMDALSIYVDLNIRKSVEVPRPEIRAQIARHLEAGAGTDRPKGVLDRVNGRRTRH